MLPIGVQLYSLRDLAQKDFVAVLKKVADIGYKLVEPAGFWNLRPSEFKKIITDLGLGMISSHSPWARSGNIGEVMEIADILGLDKIVCGYGPNEFKDMDSIKQTAEATCKMQEILARNGFTLFQHNHDFEFQRIDGKLKYESYLELCPNVKLELDCFWSTNLGKENPVEMLKKFADRTILLHMKDGVASQNVSGDKMVNGMEDPVGGCFEAKCLRGFLIRNGEIVKPLQSFTLTGRSVDILSSADALSKEVVLDGGMCGKGIEDWVRVSSGGPYMRARMIVGGGQ